MDYIALAHETADKLLALKDMEGDDAKRRQKAQSILNDYVITKYLSEGGYAPEAVDAAHREAHHFLTTFTILGPEKAAEELRIAGPRPPAIERAESAEVRAKSTGGQAGISSQGAAIPPSDPDLADTLDQFMQNESQEQKSTDSATPAAHGSTASAASAASGSAANAAPASNVTAIPAALATDASAAGASTEASSFATDTPSTSASAAAPSSVAAKGETTPHAYRTLAHRRARIAGETRPGQHPPRQARRP